MLGFLRSNGVMLALGSSAASAFNFYSFIFVPFFFGVDAFEGFVRDNYLGGLYAFGVGNSIASYGIYVFSGGRLVALKRYMLMSGVVFLAIAVLGAKIVNLPWGYVALLAGLLLHVSSFLLFVLIATDRTLSAAWLQVIQPFSFSFMLTAAEVVDKSKANWALFYFFSCLIGVLAYSAATDWRKLRDLLCREASLSVDWKAVIVRVLLSISFPLFFQVELILCGNLGGADLGEYAALQKLYASVSISLFGQIILYRINKKSNKGEVVSVGLDRFEFVLALACFLCVLAVGGLMVVLSKKSDIDFEAVVLCAVVAFLYTVSSTLGLKAHAHKPLFVVKLFFVLLFFYIFAFVVFLPGTVYLYLLLAAIFYLTYTVFVLCAGYLGAMRS